MPWVRKEGSSKATWVDMPWISNPNFKEEMMAIGKGPATWYRFNTWELQYEQIGNITFKVGQGTNAFEFPSYANTDDRKRVAVADSFIKLDRQRKKIWSETEGLLADPLDQSYSTRRTFSGSWVTRHDVNLQGRVTEILGIVQANPRIRIRSIALIYNTTSKNIMRITMVANAAGCIFAGHSAGRLTVKSFGIYDAKAVAKLYSQSNGLVAIVSKAKNVFDDVSDERTGKLKMASVKQELKQLWEAKLQNK